MKADARRAAAAIRRRIGRRVPRVGVVLGSGLGAFADTQKNIVSIPYAQIPGFPRAGVEGHAGKLVVTEKCAILSGRAHYYEGHELATVVLPVQTLLTMGCKTVILTNAAGGISKSFRPGDLVILRDHINLLGENPLRGPHDDKLGPRFPDMTDAYDPELRKLAARSMSALSLTPHEGVYACLAGPSYETPAEIEMLRRLGADLVGMSTVPETIAARAMGARVLGISCVTNMAAGSGQPLSHAEVTETAARVRPTFVKLLDTLIGDL